MCLILALGLLELLSVNTCYLYTMSSRLVNVRLDEERVRKVSALREQGLALSDVVREAIDEQFEKLNPSKKLRGVKNVIQHIFEQYPDPPGLPARTYDVRNRKAARNAILQTLQRRSR
jgi:hypothetical protein